MKKADFILIAAVLAVAGIMLFFLYGVNNSYGSFVQIEIDGEVVETLDINIDTERVIETENGGTNTLIIKDGGAEMIDANCPDGICINHKKINKNGESIICLPHKLVVSVVNEKSNGDDVDAVA